MDGYLFGDSSSNHGMHESGGPSRASHESSSEEGPVAGRWYMSRKEIEENSPSRRDAIDLKKEAYLRKSYCTFLQDLGMRLKVGPEVSNSKTMMESCFNCRPQVTIATAIIFCHRFFLRQSHAKNDRRTMATVCMFLAGKVEETPRPLKDVILVSYEIIHKKDPTASQRIKQKEVYEQQKELILLGEKLVLTTLAFDLNVNHPYKPLVEAIKKFKVAQNALAQVAWNFVNDGLRTSLCLQFKPHHIAAGAIFLASKFLKVKLPSDGDKVWWQEFDVTSRELEEVSNQMLELYEQNGVPPSQKSEAEGSAGGRAPTKTSAVDDEQVPGNGHAQAGLGAGSNAKSGTLKHISSRPAPDHHGVPLKSIQNQNNDNASTEMGSVITDHKIEGEIKENQHSEQLNVKEASKRSNLGIHRVGGEDEERNSGRIETTEAGEWRDNGTLHKPSSISSQNLESREGVVGQSPKDVIKKIDKDKVKAAIEKRKKSRTDMPRKKDVMDDDDLIERELEDGVELAAEDEKTKRERRQSWSKSENSHHRNDHDDLGDGNHEYSKGQSSRMVGEENEEGEMLDDALPKLNGRKRKGSPLDRGSEGKQRHDHASGYHRNSNNHDRVEDGHGTGPDGYTEKEHRKARSGESLVRH